MRVIGAGLGRTGTLSLKAALDQLGFGPTFHMLDLIADPASLPHWRAALDGRPVDWAEALAGWGSTVDWPGCVFWEQMLATWPDAKVILSVRDEDAWYESCAHSIHDAYLASLNDELLPVERVQPTPEVLAVIGEVIWSGVFEGRFTDKDHAIERFRRHNDEVRRKAPADRLLEWDVREGWAPLCAFLGVPAPDAPFPHLNDTDAFRRMVGLPPRV
ncbi:MAG TPA: sulfotransferase [Acidimicrobiales bacterium]|nr:sulfotransferase [Acidimicrobiales bacterium]